MGVGQVFRALARRLELRGGMVGATLPTDVANTGSSGMGQFGGGVGAEMELESAVAIPGFTRVQFIGCLDRER